MATSKTSAVPGTSPCRDDVSANTAIYRDIISRVRPPANKLLTDEVLDSGLFSFSPQTSLEPRSIKGDNSLKTPVQCSDKPDCDDQSSKITHIENTLSGLNIHDEDEGIYESEAYSGNDDKNYHHIQSQSQVNSKAPAPVEVDMYDQDEDGDTVLHVAILEEAGDLASALIDLTDAPWCLNIQNHLYQTPIHVALITCQEDIAIQLVQKGVEITRRDQRGNTALHIACYKGMTDVVEILLRTFGDNESDRNTYIRIRNYEGLTCVHLASEKKQFDVLSYLLDNGADANTGDAKSGRNILHYAVERRDLDTIRFLLDLYRSKTDLKCTTFNGETPLDLAYSRDSREIIDLLSQD